MSNAVKSGFTALIILLAAGLSLSSSSPIRADQVWPVLAIAAGTIAVMWMFPRAGF